MAINIRCQAGTRYISRAHGTFNGSPRTVLRPELQTAGLGQNQSTADNPPPRSRRV